MDWQSAAGVCAGRPTRSQTPGTPSGPRTDGMDSDRGRGRRWDPWEPCRLSVETSGNSSRRRIGAGFLIVRSRGGGEHGTERVVGVVERPRRGETLPIDTRILRSGGFDVLSSVRRLKLLAIRRGIRHEGGDGGVSPRVRRCVPIQGTLSYARSREKCFAEHPKCFAKPPRLRHRARERGRAAVRL